MVLTKTGGKSGRRERRVEVRFKLVKKPPRWGADGLVALAPLVFQACYLSYTGTKNGKLLSGGKDEELSMMAICVARLMGLACLKRMPG